MTEERSTALAPQLDAGTMEIVLTSGDLSRLTPTQRVSYYLSTCKSIGVNPLTRPFGYIMFEDKKTNEKRLELYAKKDCAEQLSRQQHVSTEIIERDLDEFGDYCVTVRAFTADGRRVDATGSVPLVDRDGKPYTGNYRSNAKMKAETKATRRATLRFCGLGWLDETEIETVPNARVVVVNDAGEIIEGKPEPPAPEPERVFVFATPQARQKFMAWACGEKALEDAEVHLALGVKHMEEFTGTRQEAFDAVNAYIEKAVTAEAEEPIQ